MPALNVLSAHNFYRNPGGEDTVFSAEAELLQERGHRVTNYERDNSQIHSGRAAALGTVWSRSSYREVRTLLANRQSTVAHFHNTFPLISPSAYYAASRQGAAIVQTLHNYRLICPGALLARGGAPCEECVTQGSLRPAITHACYRNSRSATATVVAMLASHRAAGTYRNGVDAYIALSEFAREKFVAGGLPADLIFVKPNFLAQDPGPGRGVGPYALFAGRLTPEKGIDTLAAAWGRMEGIPLYVAGDGPETVRWPSNVETLGWLATERLIELLQNASVLVYPSICYENCPLSIIQAFACGTPVIASNLGSMAELVRHGETGLLFRPGDPDDLAAQVRYAFSHPEHLAQMRINARREYEEKYTAERNYKMLIAIYEQAIENSKRRKRAAS